MKMLEHKVRDRDLSGLQARLDQREKRLEWLQAEGGSMA